MLKENKNGFKRKRRRLLFLFFLFCILFSFLNPHSLFLYLLRFAVTFSLFRASQSLSLSFAPRSHCLSLLRFAVTSSLSYHFFLVVFAAFKKTEAAGPTRDIFFQSSTFAFGSLGRVLSSRSKRCLREVRDHEPRPLLNKLTSLSLGSDAWKPSRDGSQTVLGGFSKKKKYISLSHFFDRNRKSPCRVPYTPLVTLSLPLNDRQVPVLFLDFLFDFGEKAPLFLMFFLGVCGRVPFSHSLSPR